MNQTMLLKPDWNMPRLARAHLIWQFGCAEKVRVDLISNIFPFYFLRFSVCRTPVAMRLFKRRVSDPAPQLVSLAAINSEMDQAGGSRVTANNQRYSNSSDDYADYQTVTAMPAMVVVDDAPRKGKSICHPRLVLFVSSFSFFYSFERIQKSSVVPNRCANPPPSRQ